MRGHRFERGGRRLGARTRRKRLTEGCDAAFLLRQLLQQLVHPAVPGLFFYKVSLKAVRIAAGLFVKFGSNMRRVSAGFGPVIDSRIHSQTHKPGIKIGLSGKAVYFGMQS